MFGRWQKTGRDIPKEKQPALLFEIDEPFASRYGKGIALTGTPDGSPNRKARFYNTVNLLRQTQQIEGSVAECGCWKGLSSYLMCSFIRDTSPEFRGENYFIFDSFQGLSEPKSEDSINRSIILKGRDRNGKPLKPAGSYAASVESVRTALAEFPHITMVEGWLPDSLADQPDRKYRFAHIDVDLYDPIKGSTRYFLQRMAKGGIVVCDDYGSLFWPGAKQAFDEIASEFKLDVLSLSSGQGILIAR